MTKTLSESVAYANALASADSACWPGLQPFVLPSTTSLNVVARVLGPAGRVVVGAQNAHWEDSGPWTGEVSPAQVADAGATLLEIGHSERRQHFGETDDMVNRKVQAALRNHLQPLICVGESEAVRLSGASAEHVVRQAKAALAGVSRAAPVLLAYEPIWAIGSSGRAAAPEAIEPVIAALRHADLGDHVSLLYGGSVDITNALALLEVKDIDGLFIGRAAWDVEGFVAVLDSVASATLA